MRVGQADHGVVGRGLKSARQALERNQTATMRRGAWMGRVFWAWYPAPSANAVQSIRALNADFVVTTGREWQ